MKKYKIIDYYTSKQILQTYKTEREAYRASHELMKSNMKDKVIFNNLHIIIQ